MWLQKLTLTSNWTEVSTKLPRMDKGKVRLKIGLQGSCLKSNNWSHFWLRTTNLIVFKARMRVSGICLSNSDYSTLPTCKSDGLGSLEPLGYPFSASLAWSTTSYYRTSIFTTESTRKVTLLRNQWLICRFWALSVSIWYQQLP